jgi:hypothetical protein
MAVMLNMVDAADGFLVYPSCSHSIFTRAIKLLQSQFPQVFSGTLVAMYLPDTEDGLSKQKPQYFNIGEESEHDG